MNVNVIVTWTLTLDDNHVQSVEWRTGGDFRQATARPEQPGQSRLPEPGSQRRQAAASLATLASGEAAGHL